MGGKPYLGLVSYCESFLQKYGDCHLGVGWTKRHSAPQLGARAIELMRPPQRGAEMIMRVERRRIERCG